MPKIRLYFPKKIANEVNLELTREQNHYLKNVMRRNVNDQIFIFNDDEEWVGEYITGGKEKILPIKMVRKKNEIPDIWMCFSLVKMRNINFLIEKVSEIGVKKFVPIVTDYSERINFNYERLKKIIIEAVEQSDSLNIPKLEKVVGLKKILGNWNEERRIILCDESVDSGNIMEFPLNEKKFAIFVGPIGGWSESEREVFDKKNPFKITLGKNILKADTAAIYSLACLRTLLM